MTRHRAVSAACVIAVASLLVATGRGANAQLRLSEAASVSQTIDGTVIEINYSRPRARGRTESQLFGEKLPWGEAWTPGANMATTLSVSRDVFLNGHRLRQGRYSVWMIPRASGQWTVVLDPRARRYHAERPDSTADQLRFDVQVGEGPFTPQLTWAIPLYRPDSTIITMQWFTRRVGLWVKVVPSLSAVVSAAAAAPYLGRYDLTCHEQIAEICFRDGAGPTRVSLAITHELGRLVARFDAGPRVPREFYLVPIAADHFIYGWCCLNTEGDVVAEPRDFVIIEFVRARGSVERFEVRSHSDALIAAATRRQ